MISMAPIQELYAHETHQMEFSLLFLAVIEPVIHISIYDIQANSYVSFGT